MKHTCAVALVSLSILFVAAARVSAAPGVSKGQVGALRAVAGTYSCGFDSLSGYVAPGINKSVNVGGVFTLTIDNHGAITQGDATLSVDDGGLGSAVCSYASGAGSVGTAPFTGNFGDAALTYTADNANSSLCPSGNASMTFGPVDNGLKFIYSNSSGFTGQGTCGVRLRRRLQCLRVATISVAKPAEPVWRSSTSLRDLTKNPILFLQIRAGPLLVE